MAHYIDHDFHCITNTLMKRQFSILKHLAVFNQETKLVINLGFAF
jgi:hypothetical protein